MSSIYETFHDQFAPSPTEYLSTGIANIDLILGGGFPRGKMTEIHSEAGIGKSTILLQGSTNNMANGGRVLYFDAENALSDDQKYRLGVSAFEETLLEDGAPQFIHLCPVTFDEVDEILRQVLEDDARPDLIILDSITALGPDLSESSKKKISAEEGGQGARVQARFLRRYKALLARAGVAMVIVNQMRTNLKGWRPTVKPAGGKALEFATDIRMGIAMASLPKAAKSTKTEAEEKKPNDGENKSRLVHLTACTIKNKHAVPFRQVPLFFTPGFGVDDEASLTELLIKKGLIDGAGGYYSLPGFDKKVRRSDVLDWVRNNPEVARQMLETLMI